MNNSEQKLLIEKLQASIAETISPALPKVRELLLLDFPNHSNVGDSAIYAGELAFFENTLGLQPSIVSDCQTVPWDRIAASDKNDPIFLHGGGNFGDLWPQHHHFREDLLARFPGRLVVQLPQTIHYSEPTALARTAKVIEKHGNFLLLVRDEVSYQIAKDSFRCEVRICPDMAFCIGAIDSRRQSTNPLLLLMRDDREKRPDDLAVTTDLPAGTLTADWLDDHKRMKFDSKVSAMAQAALKFELSDMKIRRNYYEMLAMKRIKRGTDLLSSASFVVTDRLHAHILSLLLGIPHIVLDNSYGKVSRFINLWTSSYSGATRADSLASALDLYKRRSAAGS